MRARIAFIATAVTLAVAAAIGVSAATAQADGTPTVTPKTVCAGCW